MQARTITTASLTLAGLCVGFCSPASAQSADPRSPTQPSYPAQTYPTQPDPNQPYQGQPYQGQPYQGQPYQGQPYQGQPYQPQPYQPQPYQGQPYQPQAGQQPYYPQQQPNYNLAPSTTVRYVSRPRVGLIIGGAVTLGVAWSLSALGAAYAGNNCGYDYYGYSSGGCYDRVWPLFIPVVGPWIQMGFGNDATTTAYLAFDGLVQAGGLAMIIAGAVTRTKVAVYAKNGLQVNPLLASGGTGLLVSGRF